MAFCMKRVVVKVLIVFLLTRRQEYKLSYREKMAMMSKATSKNK